MRYYKSRIKLHISPGVTGLVLLIPVLFLFYGYNGDVFKEHCIVVGMPDKESLDSPYSDTQLNYIKRNFIEYNFNGNKYKDHENLILADKQLHRLVDDKDTLSGVKFNFGKNATYDVFVRAISICREREVQFHYMLNNSLYVINTSQSENRKADSLRRLDPRFGPRMDCAGVK